MQCNIIFHGSRLKFDPNRPVRELSCDLLPVVSAPPAAAAALLCLPEEKLLKKLGGNSTDIFVGFSFGLKNGLRFHFDSVTCLNYPFLNRLVY